MKLRPSDTKRSCECASGWVADCGQRVVLRVSGWVWSQQSFSVILICYKLINERNLRKTYRGNGKWFDLNQDGTIQALMQTAANLWGFVTMDNFLLVKLLFKILKIPRDYICVWTVSSKWSLRLILSGYNFVCIYHLSGACYVLRPSHFPSFGSAFLTSPTSVTYLVHLIVLVVIILLIYDEEYKLWRSSLYILSLASCWFLFLRSKYSSQHALLKRPQSMFLKARDQLSHQYKTTFKVIVLYTLIFMFSYRRWEDKRFLTRW
jgi:hypothetical protein